MKVLGIDPGSHATGWGLVAISGSRIEYVASGIIRAASEQIGERLLQIANALDALLSEHTPDAVSVESIFFAKNSQSAIKLGQARGAILLCIARAGAPIFEYTPMQVKQAVTGHGHAVKEQVQTMVRVLLGLRDMQMALDTSDALAAALCHAQMHSTPTASMLRQLQRQKDTR